MVDARKKNFDKSPTTKVDEPISCGIQFLQYGHLMYQKSNMMSRLYKRFCKYLREHLIKIIDFKKYNNAINKRRVSIIS